MYFMQRHGRISSSRSMAQIQTQKSPKDQSIRKWSRLHRREEKLAGKRSMSYRSRQNLGRSRQGLDRSGQNLSKGRLCLNRKCPRWKLPRCRRKAAKTGMLPRMEGSKIKKHARRNFVKKCCGYFRKCILLRRQAWENVCGST